MSSPKTDDIIQATLNDSANGIEFSTDLFPVIKAGVSGSKGWKAAGSHFYLHGISLSMRIFLTTSGIILLLLSCTLFSKDFRVMAEDLFNSVKTIFLVEGTPGDYQVVEKPVESQLYTPNVSQDTRLSDSEISQKIGYQVSFPEPLSGNFSIDCKALGLALEKQMKYYQMMQLQSSMIKAITDDLELEKLKIYGVKWSVFGVYQNDQMVTVFITISRRSNQAPSQIKNPVFIGNIQGQWQESVLPEYPFKKVNGIGNNDISKKPETVRIAHHLSWERNGLCYLLSFYKGNELSMAESIKVAESFMAGGNKGK